MRVSGSSHGMPVLEACADSEHSAAKAAVPQEANGFLID
ncbi:hypothetical protein JCM19233_5301 [Vibrio astriarenae]|nr:hypothetical protein JCM19233_5301 [Vibrio sp. C7]